MRAKKACTAGYQYFLIHDAKSLHGFNHIFDDLFSVSEDHHGAVHVKEVAIKAGVRIKGLE
jgi:hypothetical protein